jgi:Leucine-rich repeat (LRR) protein
MYAHNPFALPSLHILYYLRGITDTSECTELEELYLVNNKITAIQGLEKLTKLKLLE